ncbi:hypothetical protein D3C71_1644120 [compost metagenome]
MFFARLGSDIGSIGRTHHNDPIIISDDDVTGMDDNAADGNGHVDFTRTILVGTCRRNARCKDREIHFAQRRQIADRTIDDHAAELLAHRSLHHQLAGIGIGEIAMRIEHDDIARLRHVQRLVQKQVVAGAAFYRECRSEHIAL